MNHKIQTRGDTVSCCQCGRQWDIHDEMPVDCALPPPSFGQLYAFLVGPQTPNTNHPWCSPTGSTRRPGR